MSDKIDTVTARNKLKSRRDPYWQRATKGLFVGFRKMTPDAAGTWIIRYRAVDGIQLRQNLGSLEQFPAATRFDKATDEAQKWHKHINLGGAKLDSTLMEACKSYADKIRALKGPKAADDLEDRYRRWVANDPIQRIKLAKLTRDDVNAFRQRMVEAPVKVGQSGKTRTRSKTR